MTEFPEGFLSKCDNFFVKAKRALLNVQLDKIANLALSDNRTPAQHTDEGMLCSYPEIANESEPEALSEIDDFMKAETQPKINPIDLQPNPVPDKAIAKKYFIECRNLAKAKTTTTGKLDDFMTNLKSQQHKSRPNSSIINRPFIKMKNFENSKSSEYINRTFIKTVKIKKSKSSESFKNRFESQKTIIDLQRLQIDEQTKIINELKLGIIREDLIKSIENTKINIREIFSNCSGKLLAQAPMLQAVEEREKMMITSQRAPKTYQKMHQRAIERAEYRELILENKRVMEEARQKLLEEALEKKKVLKEEERKRNLEIINEQRKKELQLQKMRRENALEYERKLALATDFHKKLLMQQSFKKLLINYLKSKENETLAIEYYRRKQKSQVFKTWWGHVEAKQKIKDDIADAHCEFKILKRAFEKFKEFKLECKRAMQVAEDYYDLSLTINTFKRWQRYTCEQNMLERKKTEIAEKHYLRRLLYNNFFQWRFLPAVLRLEKARDERRRKWRDKVWEILLDFQPPDKV